MVRDYSERRQVRSAAAPPPKPPKRPSVWPSLLMITALVIAAFVAGFGTAWYLYRPGGKFYKVPPAVQPPPAKKQESALPPQGEPIAPASQTPQSQSAPEKGNGAPPLTFYNTLQKGNKSLIGTGINSPKEAPQQAQPAPQPPSQPKSSQQHGTER